ncbi:MAG: hypothetical protein ACK4OM_07445 [Alphaproteobacteria bacterium]
MKKLSIYFKHNVYLVILYILAICMVACSYNYKGNLSVYDLLEDYGYSNESQKKSLEYLMRQANIIPETQTLAKYFPARANHNDLLKDILKFVKETQKSFTIRSAAQERWEVQGLKWMKKNTEQNIMALKDLGFINKISPNIKNPDAICILGATMPSMERRIDYVKELLTDKKLQTQNIILLAGERYVTSNADGDEIKLLDIARKYGFDSVNKLTETHLIQELYLNSPLHKIPYYVIDTPRNNLPRPTTETTIIKLKGWLSEHKEIKSIVFVSSQPNVKYQAAVINETLKNIDVKFEVVGPAASADTKVHNIIGALGSEIWAKTPSVISKLNYKNWDKELVQEFKQLYSKNPLINKNVEKLFDY